MKLALVDTDPAALAVDALVVGLYQGAESAAVPSIGGDASSEPAPPVLAEPAGGLAEAFGGQLVEALRLLGATGTAGEVTKLASLGAVPAPVVAAVGLGTPEAVTAETLRRAAGAAVRALAGSDTVGLALPTGHGLRPLAEGAALGGYRFGGYASEPKPGEREPVDAVRIVVADAADPAADAEVRRAGALGDASAQVRNWVNAAPNELGPAQFAESVAAAADKAGLAAEVLDEDALRAGGYGGLLAVGCSSPAGPRLVRLEYRPDGPTTSRIALVGKGITFDSGGLSIKPAVGMWDMKCDMSGAAAVAGAMLAIAALKPAATVVGYLAIAENLVSGGGYRPGDVITMYSGKRVEILNTDAEGRIVLGDAIARACEDEPDYLFETSTLTGGQVTALGKRYCGVMGDDELLERVRAAGDAVGELMWPMPLAEDVRSTMKSDVADLMQVSSGMERAGHMLQGGIFLSEFVADGVGWAHIDMAGPAYQSEAYGYLAKGSTGVPMRTLVQLVDDIAANG